MCVYGSGYDIKLLARYGLPYQNFKRMSVGAFKLLGQPRASSQGVKMSLVKMIWWLDDTILQTKQNKIVWDKIISLYLIIF